MNDDTTTKNEMFNLIMGMDLLDAMKKVFDERVKYQNVFNQLRPKRFTKCQYCGKFTSPRTSKFVFVPDSELTTEESYHLCKKCECYEKT